MRRAIGALPRFLASSKGLSAAVKGAALGGRGWLSASKVDRRLAAEKPGSRCCSSFFLSSFRSSFRERADFPWIRVCIGVWCVRVCARCTEQLGQTTVKGYGVQPCNGRRKRLSGHVRFYSLPDEKPITTIRPAMGGGKIDRN